MAEKKQKVSEIKKSYPEYFISKNKIQLDKGIDVSGILKSLENKFKDNPLHTIDGLKIESYNFV